MKIQYKNQHLTIFESALYRTNTTLFRNEDLTLLTDPNWLPNEIAEIKTYVDSARRKTPNFHLLFTHSDYDHIIAFRVFDNAKVIASKAFVDNPNKEQVIQEILDFDDKNYITRPYPISYPTVNEVIEEDGTQLQVGKTTLTFYKANGHTNDGLFTIIEPYRIWIAGDYLCNVEFPFIYHSSAAYLETIERMETIMKTHKIQYLIPGHGSISSDLDEIHQRIEDSKNYILELRHAIANNEDFDKAKWLGKYPFPKFLEPAHENNVLLIKKELNC